MPSHVRVQRVPEIIPGVRCLLLEDTGHRTLVVREDAMSEDEAEILAFTIATCPDSELPSLLDLALTHA